MRASISGRSIAVALLVLFTFGLMLAHANWSSCTIFLIAALGIAIMAFWPRLPRKQRPTASPVFVESEEFFVLDPVDQSLQRKQLAQRLQSRINRGDRILTP